MITMESDDNLELLKKVNSWDMDGVFKSAKGQFSQYLVVCLARVI